MDEYTQGYHNSLPNAGQPRSIDVAKNRIEPLFPGLVFDTAGGGAPFQATGSYLEGADFYFRFRHDSATLTIGKPARHVPENNFRSGKHSVTGNDYAGDLGADDFVALFTELMQAILAETGVPRPTL